MSIKVIPSRTPNDRFNRFKVVYSDVLDLNGYSVPVTLGCSVDTDSLSKLRDKLELCLSESVVSEYYPNGIADTYRTEIKKIGFSFKCLPVADLQVMLPLIWGSFKTALETSDLHYHIPGWEFTEYGGRVVHTNHRCFAIEYDAGHDLFDVLGCVLSNFTKGTIVKNVWTSESDKFGAISITDDYDDGINPYVGKMSFCLEDIVKVLYDTYKGNF